MSRRFFLDTNVLIYGFAKAEPTKREKALALAGEALENGNGLISWQVVQEALNVVLRKLSPPLSTTDTSRYLDRVLLPLCRVWPNAELYRSCVDIKDRWGFSVYDSLIIAAAMQSNCEVLYTEDLQHRQNLDGLLVVNPFAP